MARTEHIIGTTPDRVFAILADGWTYSDWVVGTAHIRAVDRDYPTPGTSLHHKVGPWPLSIRDKSVVLDWEPDRMLLLKVRMWPIGEGVVRFVLNPIGDDATRVTMIEHFPGGPIRWVYTRVSDLGVHWRNKETLRRLADLATRRVPAAG